MMTLKDPGAEQALPHGDGVVTVKVYGDTPHESDVGLDLDASAFMLGARGKVRGDHDFIFYNQPASACGAVRQFGDTEDYDALDTFEVDLGALPADVSAVAFVLTIYEAASRRQDLRAVSNLALSVSRGEALGRVELTCPKAGLDAVALAELARVGDGWVLRVRADWHGGGLGSIARALGVNV
jgi:tellurium resistance protein TerD